jgi:hypothetical protein
VTTLTTVGYGDISAGNTLERFVCVINEVIGVIIFSILMSKLTQIVSLSDLNDEEHLDF